MKKQKATLNKPVYIDLLFLDRSMTMMYEFLVQLHKTII